MHVAEQKDEDTNVYWSKRKKKDIEHEHTRRQMQLKKSEFVHLTVAFFTKWNYVLSYD